MIDSNTAPVKNTERDDISDLQEQLFSQPEKKQLQLLDQLASYGSESLPAIAEFLRAQRGQTANPVMGKAHQILDQAKTPETQEFLDRQFPESLVTLESEKNIDYQPLARALLNRDFFGADRLTLEKLCELAGEAAIKRKWLYFSEVDKFPVADLQTIDRLWFVYSEGRFGFSVQREIWLARGQDFSKLWSKIGWRTGNNWTRYPHEFIWNSSAPRGHLPLSNQLRGVRVIASLLSHPAWSKD
ncbi:MAG: GUN4 N-terminal ARM-like repeat domain-containing protein [Cyanobacteriota bacterium]|nr:GUN4 N-terminal ARM-like repeat domain-containing protein [Cyanobacteriota bacterium]